MAFKHAFAIISIVVMFLISTQYFNSDLSLFKSIAFHTHTLSVTHKTMAPLSYKM